MPRGGACVGLRPAITTYTLKAVVYDASGVRTLDIYVNGTVRLSTTTIDDTWDGGAVGLYRVGSTTTTTPQWDNFRCGLDTTDPPDQAVDEVYADYNFDGTWNEITLAHDDAGNLTRDGLFQYKYDAWNRLAGVWYNDGDVSDPNECVARYEYDGLFRRIEKTVTNQGSGLVPDSDAGGTITGIQAGDRHEHYYWGGMGVSPVNWRLVEVRDGSDQTLGQYVWGVQYLDEPVRYDRNTDVDADNDCVEAADRSYFYHQDANYRVVMLTDEDGNVVERVAYTAYGAPTVYGGYSSTAGAEAGNAMLVSRVGNPFLHQGLFYDRETQTHQNRFRQLDSALGRFGQRDPLYADQLTMYEYVYSAPLHFTDLAGLRNDWGLGDVPRESKPRVIRKPRRAVVFYDGQDPGARIRNRNNQVVDVANGEDFTRGAWNRRHNLAGNDYVTSLRDIGNDANTALKNIKDGSVDHLEILGHGNDGGQVCGGRFLNADTTQTICKKMSPGGTIQLWGCEVGKNPGPKGPMCQIVKACQGEGVPVNVCGCSGSVQPGADGGPACDGCNNCVGPGGCN